MGTPPIRRSPLHHARVVGAVDLTPRMRRVTVQAESLGGVTLRPAQDVELHLREASGRRVKRRYTISASRPAGVLDLDVLLHGDGPGSRWGASAQAGDEVEFQGPRGKLELHSAPAHLLIGDESALPAIAAICSALPPGEHATAVIEVRDTSDELPVAAQDVRWAYRGDDAAGYAGLLEQALEPIAIAGRTRGYLMGETRAMIALRGVLEARGVAHDDIFVKGYWNLGRVDRLTGRAPAR